MKKIINYIVLVFLLVIGLISYAQQNSIDSLILELKLAKEDTNKINTFNLLSDNLWKVSDYDRALQYGNEAIALCNKLASKNGVKESIINAKRAAAYTSLAVVYKEQADYPKSLKNHLIALKIREKLKDKKDIADSYNNIGIVYKKQGNLEAALENYFISLKIKEEIGDRQGCAYSYNNIGNIFSNQQKYQEALENYSLCLKIMEEIGDKQGVASSFNNIGIVYDYQGNYKEALKNYFASLKIKEEIGDKQGMASSNINIGEVSILVENYADARKHLNKALMLSTEIGSKAWMQDSYLALATLDTLLGDWKSAFKYYQLHSEIKDSIFNEEGTRSMAEMQTKYETEKKESEIKLLHKDKEVQGKDLEKQKTIRNTIILSLLLVLIFAVVMYNRFKVTQNQKVIIEKQKNLVEEKQKEIIDSIKYAKRIQDALMTSQGYIERNLKRLKDL